MTPEYEYRINVDAAELDVPAAVAGVEVPAVELGPELQKHLRDMIDALEEMDGGGWEPVSHDVFTHGNVLFVTWLLRRPSGESK